MDRRDFIKVTGGVACLSAKASALEAARSLLGKYWLHEWMTGSGNSCEYTSRLS